MSQQHREYFNQIAGQWNEMVPLESDLKMNLIKFGVGSNDYVLDIGAGTGRLTFEIAKVVGIKGKVLACDIANEMLQKISPTMNNTLCLCSDACFCALKNECFDKIICFSTFPHIINQKAALHEFYRLLKPNGKLLIYHTKCSRKLNAFHNQLNKFVCKDELPRAVELEKTAQAVGLLPIKTIEHPDLYWVESYKPTIN